MSALNTSKTLNTKLKVGGIKVNYSLGIFKDVFSGLVVEIGMSGNKYYIYFVNNETKEMTSKHFDDIDKAMAAFNKMVELLIKGFGSEEYKREVLKSL